MTNNNGFNGLIIYNIQLNESLSGVYRNQHDKGSINLEIAVKCDKSIGISGEYDCMYFQDGQQHSGVKLKIGNAKGLSSLSFEWRNNKGLIFEGIGYLMSQKQIAVHYWAI